MVDNTTSPIDLNVIVNKPSEQITEEEFTAAVKAVQSENPAVRVEVKEKLEASRASARMTVMLPDRNVELELSSVGIGGIIQRARRAQARARVATGEINAELVHVTLIDDDEQAAVLRVPNDSAGREFAGKKAPTGANVIECRIELQNIVQKAHEADQAIARLYETQREHAANFERARGLVENDATAYQSTVTLRLGANAVAIEFKPVEHALNVVRGIAGAQFRKGVKLNDILNRPHWVVPVDQIRALEKKLSQIDAAVRASDEERAALREANRTTARCLQGEHGPVAIELTEDETALLVSFIRDPHANQILREECAPRFDRNNKSWLVDLEKAHTLEKVLPRLRETLESSIASEREAQAARVQRNEARQAEQEDLRRKTEVVLANIECPTVEDRNFLDGMARRVASDKIADAEEVHSFRALIRDYPDYSSAMGLPTDIRNGNARRAYQTGQRARDARQFIVETYDALSEDTEDSTD